MKSFGTLVGKTTRAAIASDRQIKRVISQIVPASTLKHIAFCRLEGGRVRITVDSAAWVSRLRFSERQIIDAMRSQRLDVHTASYHVVPSETPPPRKTIRVPERTQSGAASLEAAASAVNDSDGNDQLRQELLKLARTLREK